MVGRNRFFNNNPSTTESVYKKDKKKEFIEAFDSIRQGMFGAWRESLIKLQPVELYRRIEAELNPETDDGRSFDRKQFLKKICRKVNWLDESEQHLKQDIVDVLVHGDLISGDDLDQKQGQALNDFNKFYPSLEYWRLFVDGRFYKPQNNYAIQPQEIAWLSYDKREPGAMHANLKGLKFLLNSVGKGPVSKDFILALHEKISNDGNKQIQNPGQFRSRHVHFHLHNSSGYTPNGLRWFLEQLNSNPILAGSKLSIASYTDKSERRVTEIDSKTDQSIIQPLLDKMERRITYYSTFEGFDLAERIESILSSYYDEIDTCTSADEKLAVIAKHIQLFELLHPFEDGNGRVFANLLLTRFLLENNFPPATFEDPNIFDLRTVPEIVKLIEEGISNTLQIYKDVENGRAARLFDFETHSIPYPSLRQMGEWLDFEPNALKIEHDEYLSRELDELLKLDNLLDAIENDPTLGKNQLISGRAKAEKELRRINARVLQGSGLSEHDYRLFREIKKSLLFQQKEMVRRNKTPSPSVLMVKSIIDHLEKRKSIISIGVERKIQSIKAALSEIEQSGFMTSSLFALDDKGNLTANDDCAQDLVSAIKKAKLPYKFSPEAHLIKMIQMQSDNILMLSSAKSSDDVKQALLHNLSSENLAMIEDKEASLAVIINALEKKSYDEVAAFIKTLLDCTEDVDNNLLIPALNQIGIDEVDVCHLKAAFKIRANLYLNVGWTDSTELSAINVPVEDIQQTDNVHINPYQSMRF